MGMQDLIKDRQAKPEGFRFELIDDDAIIFNGNYNGMRLSDIFIINPSYLDYILGYKNADPGLKMIAQSIKDNYETTSIDIDREIALR
jgi:hypothetical protein